MRENSGLYNGSGCKDPTAYEVIKTEDARERAERLRLTRLIDCIKTLIELTGFELTDRIRLRDKVSGKEYR